MRSGLPAMRQIACSVRAHGRIDGDRLTERPCNAQVHQAEPLGDPLQSAHVGCPARSAAPMTRNEDHYASWAWLILTAAVVLFVAGFDLWAHYTGHKLMTTQFRLWLGVPVTGPFIFAVWVAVFAGLTYHWFLKGAGR